MQIICPAENCRTANDPDAEKCIHCGTRIKEYIHIITHQAQLFNEGVTYAHKGDLSRARDLFAAVVYWYPQDIEARAALAMACISVGDLKEAYRHWELILEQAPENTLAQQNIVVLRRCLKRKRPIKNRKVSIKQFAK
ncbi:hypothetical protein KSC_039660 [Ktedonobacter sp. SOSP1-52]|uniref:tetratricopeptide repeat protein n=1 Tax=Ktedonobacter sp. SOSP1-52 TaxID=2778366 RepID=UPI001915602C|nr:tetratricopeptide repeat protein [Ktedonobacter sp. SOSP1-52]GHO65074.1 hypothetical protein KSC_039660 [Ktedonobacter sp. SOSP1-52]